MKKFVSILLGLCLAFFLADGVVSLLDDSLIVFGGVHAFTGLRGLLSFLCILTTIPTYFMMGITPMIPKRFFLPITLFFPAASLGAIPLSIYHSDQLSRIGWVVSFLQCLVGLIVVGWLHGGFRFRRPIIPAGRVGDRAFGWLNLFGFVMANVFLVAPCCLLYFAWCGSQAVDHFSGGFLALRSDRLVARAKQYVRSDGKTIDLVPMMHIGEATFYQDLTKSFPTNSAILLEGVSDRKNLLKRPLSYKRVASSLGLSEQKDKFEPTRGRPRPADVDVEQFSGKSLEFLNLAILVHSQGLTPEVIVQLIQQSQDSMLLTGLFEDLLTRRNVHLLKEIQSELQRSDKIVVPWGAAHMLGVSEGIQKFGFREATTQEYNVLHYRTILRNSGRR